MLTNSQVSAQRVLRVCARAELVVMHTRFHKLMCSETFGVKFTIFCQLPNVLCITLARFLVQRDLKCVSARDFSPKPGSVSSRLFGVKFLIFLQFG